MKIILLRHGPPDFIARSVGPDNPPPKALHSYEVSSVKEPPPDHLRQLAQSANLCVTSEFERARNSATLLQLEPVDPTNLFNEAGLPHPNQLYIQLPWPVFLTLFRVLWLFGYRRNCRGRIEDRQQARRACDYLCKAATQHKSVIGIGHGIMNRLICAELKKSGWSVASRSGTGYWSSITLQKIP